MEPMATTCHAPARRSIGRAPSGNPLPRRGQVLERIVKNIGVAVGTAAALACDRTAGSGAGKNGCGADKAPTAVAGAKKNRRKMTQYEQRKECNCAHVLFFR
jgi:hypothetical protein